MDSKLTYEGTTLARFGDAALVTLGCSCGSGVDCDCMYYSSGDIEA